MTRIQIPSFILSATASPQPHTQPTSTPTQKSPKRPPRIAPLHTATRVHFTNRTQTLTTPPWRFILLSDGHIHNLLSILVEQPLPLTLLSTDMLPSPPPLFRHERLPNAPCIRRTITLNSAEAPLLHASSVWNRRMYENVMQGRERSSLHHVFAGQRLEVSRAVLAVHYGTCDELCPLFGVEKGARMWARDYVFRQNGVPFLLVHEILSPQLQQYLGQIVPPQQLRDPSLGSDHVTLGEDNESLI